MAFRLFIPLLLIFVLFLYVAYLNPGPVDFVYAPGKQKSIPVAAIAMFAFFAGAAAMSILYSFKSLGNYIYGMRDRLNLFRKKRVKERLVKARQKMDKGKLQKAVNEVEKALATDPANFDALTLKGSLLRRLGDSQRALEAHSLALAQRPLERSSIIQLKEDYQAAGQIDSAYKLLDRIRTRSPKDAGILREMREISQTLGNLKRAIVLQKEILKLSSGSKDVTAEKDKAAELYCLHGERLSASGKTAEAKREFLMAAKIHPGFLPAHMMMSDIAMRQSGLTEAEGPLKKEFKRTRSLIVARKLEELYREAGKDGDVEKLYRWAISVSPGDKLLKIFLAMTLIKKSDFQSAEKELKEVETEFGQWTLYSLARGIVELNNSGNAVSATNLFKKALEQEWSVFMHYHCGACKHKARNYFARCPSCERWNSAHPLFF